MILPAMGAVSEIIPVFARKTIFGYKVIAFSSLAIALFGYLVWGHHMFTSGMSDTARMIFSLLTFLVAIPSGIKVFNWVASLYKGSITAGCADALHAHLHFPLLHRRPDRARARGARHERARPRHLLHRGPLPLRHVRRHGASPSSPPSTTGFPRCSGRCTKNIWQNLPAIILFIGFNMLYFSMFVLGWQGMPRRYYDYLPKFNAPNLVSTIGSWILAMGLFIMFYNLFRRSGQEKRPATIPGMVPRSSGGPPRRRQRRTSRRSRWSRRDRISSDEPA